jgi:hypothetical protein
MALEPLEPKMTEMGPMPVPGLPKLSLGAIASFSDSVFFGGKWRVAGLVGSPTRASVLGDVWGNGRLRVAAQAERGGGGAATDAAVSLTLTGTDYVGVARVRLGGGGEVMASYNQRLSPGSPLQVGGEACVNVGEAARLARDGGASEDGKAPFEFAAGVAWDGHANRTALNFSRSRTFPAGTVSAQHSLRVTERATLASKLIVNVESKHSMVAAGYRLHFRNTLTTLHGMVDSYGGLKQVVEYEPVKDLRVGVGFETRFLGAQEGQAHVGMMVTLGPLPRTQPPLSPLTMTRDIFGMAP